LVVLHDMQKTIHPISITNPKNIDFINSVYVLKLKREMNKTGL
jgi:hypothetical protein